MKNIYFPDFSFTYGRIIYMDATLLLEVPYQK